MLKLFYSPVPAGYKAFLILEELNIPYDIKHVNIFKGVQKDPDYIKIVPTVKVPAIIENGKVFLKQEQY